MTDETQDAGLALMRVKFPAHQISQLPKGGIMLSFVGHAALTDRLLDADPAWTWEPVALDSQGLPAIDEIGGLWIRLTVCGITRLGYGDAQGKTGGNAMKERIGDALRNAAMRFGAALDLWHKGDLHIDVADEEGREWAEQQAAPIRLMFSKFDIAGAANHLNTLGVGLTYDGEAKEAVWAVLESPLRSAIKSFDAITQAKTLEALKAAWAAAPKHAHHLLEGVKESRKAALTTTEEKEAA